LKLGLIDQITLVLAIITLILFCDLGLTSVLGQTNEDQLQVCNFKDICTIINQDDYLSKKSIDKIWNNFNNDIDTYDMSDMTQNKADYNEDMLISLDNICRDEYHSFCFGQAWNSLQDALN
jgi:hypothetical protein